MSQDPRPAPVVRLPVLPSTDRLEQWRRQSAEPPAASADLALTSHVNRTEAGGLAALNRHPLEDAVVQALRTVYDPELPVNVYDLGLVYRLDISPENDVSIAMTLTAPGCPVAGTLPPEVARRVEAVPGVRSARVELVWQPTWSREMMSEVARLELGL
jgi:FeS assembly SUF system protein